LNYYRVNGQYAQNYAQFRNCITRQIVQQSNNTNIVVRLYVENYSPATFNMSFILPLVPNATTARYTRMQSTSGEFEVLITQGVYK
jgi:hypothetical protein